MCGRTEVEVETRDCSDAMVKSAFAEVCDAV